MGYKSTYLYFIFDQGNLDWTHVEHFNLSAEVASVWNINQIKEWKYYQYYSGYRCHWIFIS